MGILRPYFLMNAVINIMSANVISADGIEIRTIGIMKVFIKVFIDIEVCVIVVEICYRVVYDVIQSVAVINIPPIVQPII